MNAADRNVYHIFTMNFCGGPEWAHEQNGTENRIQKVLNLVPYLKDLHVNTVLFGPLFSSVSHGYDTTDYKTVDARLGTNADLKAVCETLHEAGFEILFDCVFNHVGREHFAFKDLQQNRENSRYKDWFLDVNFYNNNGYNDGFSYANWAGYDNLVKLNLNNPEVREYLKSVFADWIDEYDIDGVRLDAANVMDRGFLAELSDFARWKKPGFFLMGEIVGGDYHELITNGHLDSVTDYECFKGLYSSLNDKNYFEIAHSIRRLFNPGALIAGVPAANFVDNHDVNRVASTLRDERLLYPLYLLLYTMPGFPSIYYGSEQGYKGVKENGSDAPLRPPYEAIDFSEDTPLYQFIARLGKIRENVPALRDGEYQEGFIQSEQYGFKRVKDGDTAVVALNMADHDAEAPVNLYGVYVDLLSGDELDIDGNVAVPAFSGRILYERDKVPMELKKNAQKPCKEDVYAGDPVEDVENNGAVITDIEQGPTQPEERVQFDDKLEDTEKAAESADA